MLFGVMCALGGGHCEGHYLVCFNGLGVILMDINRPFISEWMKFLNMMIIGFFLFNFHSSFDMFSIGVFTLFCILNCAIISNFTFQ